MGFINKTFTKRSEIVCWPMHQKSRGIKYATFQKYACMNSIRSLSRVVWGFPLVEHKSITHSNVQTVHHVLLDFTIFLRNPIKYICYIQMTCISQIQWFTINCLYQQDSSMCLLRQRLNHFRNEYCYPSTIWGCIYVMFGILLEKNYTVRYIFDQLVTLQTFDP